MRLSTFLILAIGSLRLLGCASEPDGTTVAGSVQLTRQSDAETGQTGFVFAGPTRLDESPIYGSCVLDDASGQTILMLDLERAAPDPFGLAAFSLELPIQTPVQPGSVKVTAQAGGTTFADATGSCTAWWSGYDEYLGHVEVAIDCAALSGGEGAEAVSLSADLTLDGCQ